VHRRSARVRRKTLGLLLGLIGVLAFSLTLPMTRFAVAELDPWFLRSDGWRLRE